MSHVIRKINIGNSALIETTIVDYLSGGEPYTLAELGIIGPVSGATFLTPASWNGDLVSTIKPRLQLPNVILEIGPGIELSNMVGVNFTFVAIVHGA